MVPFLRRILGRIQIEQRKVIEEMNKQYLPRICVAALLLAPLNPLLAKPTTSYENITRYSAEIGPFRTTTKGRVEPVLSSEVLEVSRQRKELYALSTALLSTLSLDEEEIHRSEVPINSLTKFTNSKWDIVINESGTGGWITLQPQALDNRAKAEIEPYDARSPQRKVPRLDSTQIKSKAMHVAEKILPLLGEKADEGFGFTVTQIGHSSFGFEADDQEGHSRDTVTSYVALVRRTYRGIDFIGPGSSLLMEFDTSGDIVHLDFDWSNLTPSESKYKISGPTSNLPPSAVFSGKSAGVEVARVERRCGYYDAGQYGDQKELPIQISCLVDRELNVIQASTGTVFRTSTQEIRPAQLMTTW